MTKVEEILEKGNLEKETITALLLAGEDESGAIFRKAREIKKEFVGNRVYFRGLIEYSNYCAKNCFYCGIRSGNSRYARYEMTGDEVLEAARYAWQNRFASIVLNRANAMTRASLPKLSN